MDKSDLTNAEPAFDQATALSRMDDDHVFLKQLAAIFVEESPRLIAEIRAAIEEHDGGRLERAAHKLKGSSYPFCASAVTDMAQTFESLGASGQIAAAKAEQPRFEIAIQRLLTVPIAYTTPADSLASQNLPISGSESAAPCTT